MTDETKLTANADDLGEAPDAGKLIEALTDGKATPSNDAPPIYTVRGLWDIACLDLPPLDYLWNGLALVPGAVVEVIGAPGIGKSRVLGDLARHQILGRDFGGRQTLKTPVKWLFAGSENGIHRLNYETIKYLLRRTPKEVRGMSEDERFALAEANGFSREDVHALDENFKTFTLENPEDFDISLANEENIPKLIGTMKEHRPRVFVIDPWGDAIAGKELDDGDVRRTVRIVRQCLALAGIRDAIIIVINHARMGATEEANARGTDEGNFGKNSKCIYSIARYVINIRRGSFDDNPDIELINAKNNDGRKQPPVALRLDGETMSYNPIIDFDHEAWQKALDEAAGKHPKNAGRTQTDKDAIWTAIREELAKTDEGVLPYGDLVKILRNNHDIGKSAAEGYITSCVRSGKSLCTTQMMKEGKDGTWTASGNSTVYGLPASIAEYKRKYPKGVKC